MFDNVIVGVDAPQAGGGDALELAKQLASPHAQLTLAHVDVVPRQPWPPPADAVAKVARARALERLAQLREESQVGAQLVCVEAPSVAAGLHELAVGGDADLVAIGASRRDDYERTFLGDDTRAVLEKAPCPVAVAPIGHAIRRPALKRIGAAYDGSPASKAALAVARDLAREHTAELSAFEAVAEPAYVHSIVNPQPEIDAGLAEARERIAGLGGVEAHAASGDDVAEALARYGASVDLLIIGSHHYRPIDHLLSGSTAQRVADKPPCPLLVLSPSHPTA